MGNKKSTCLYIDKEILKTAKRIGLNISKVSENALVEMIGRLKGPENETLHHLAYYIQDMFLL